jgi:nicotinate-nucleotide pyrophosphorylase (carboxylating)
MAARQKPLRGLSRAISSNVRAALKEDVGRGDVTAALVPADQRAHATVSTRQAAIVCGQAWFNEVFHQLDAAIEVHWGVEEGQLVAAGQQLCAIEGLARPLLTGERAALNFLQTLSGVASVTRRYVDAVAGTRCRILDTRKTIPGLRLAQKHAVRTGGGSNHRIGLFDAMLIKENHIVAAGSISAAVRRGRVAHPKLLLEVEVETLAQLEEAIAAGVDRVLLDNFDIDGLRAAVAVRDRSAGKVALEASGNIMLAQLPQVAATGVDFISVGSLTKNITAIDLSMRFRFAA